MQENKVVNLPLILYIPGVGPPICLLFYVKFNNWSC